MVVIPASILADNEVAAAQAGFLATLDIDASAPALGKIPEVSVARPSVRWHAATGTLVVQRIEYVPLYSSLYISDHTQPIDISATLSLRNVSQRVPVVVTAVDYYDSDGQLIRHFLDQPAELGPLETAEYFVARADRSGGSGANFLVHWGLREPGPDLLVQALMHGRDGNAGVSFLTEGRVIDDAPPAAKP